MTEKHYLLKVLGLSGVPKLLTFSLTLLSFPILIRSLGANEYGVVIFISAALGIFEVMVDFGVSSAAGKAMASVRASQPQVIRSEFFAWARLQTFFVIVGFAPMLLAARFAVKSNTTFQFEPELMYVLGLAVIIQVALNFIRANLLSLLSFKSLAVLDTFESVSRSAGFLIVAFLFPKAMGLALAGLVTSFVVTTLAIVLIWRRLSSKDLCDALPDPNYHVSPAPASVKSRIHDSLNFLWLRLSTRLFQQGPLLLLGQMVGSEVVGIVGAFGKINEIVSTPYLVIGNALMVRVHEISRKGSDALQTLWDAVLRIMSTAQLFAALVLLAAAPLANALLPESPQAPEFFAILALMIIASSTFSLVAPMSDYMGGLSSRNTLLTSMAMVQFPLLWISATLFHAVGAVLAYVSIFLVLAIGYVLIASKVFFNKYSPRLRFEVLLFSQFVFFALILAASLGRLSHDLGMPSSSSLLFVIMQTCLFLIMVGVGVFMNKKTRNFYFDIRFFEFSPETMES